MAGAHGSPRRQGSRGVHVGFIPGCGAAAHNRAMFRKRLTIALAVLAAAAVLEDVVALWAVGAADRHVRRGRVASDIHAAFIELSADKQQLRTWVSQAQLDAGAAPAQREALLAQMRGTLERLERLSQQAIDLDPGMQARPEHLQRHDTLVVLGRSLDHLGRTIAEVRPLPAGTDAQAAWDALTGVFDMAEGRDLRSLIAGSIARESAAMERERRAADSTLLWTRVIWMAAAATLALAALLLAAYFTRALRRPLDRLTDGVHALQRGELGHRIPASGSDEFALVARSVNAMAAELAVHREQEAQVRQRLEELVHARTAELQRALETLQQVDARRRQLFADISHELRTLTTAIRGEAEISLRGRDKPTEDYKAALQRIVDLSRQLTLVIDDLLTMARSDIDALSLHRHPIDLSAPLEQALAQAQALAHERQVEVIAEPAAVELPVLGDATRLRQVLMLLLDNAVRYSRPGGTVRVRSRRARDDAGAAHAEVQVIDQGIGIAPQDLPRVFERNFRGAAARRHRADGTGLGLSIGRALARAHGGEIAIGSEAGCGTTATLHQPTMVGEAVG